MRGTEEFSQMEHKHMVLWVAIGVFVALTTTVNTMVAGIINPLLSSLTGGKATYV